MSNRVAGQALEDRRYRRSASGGDRAVGLFLSRSGDGRRRRHRLHIPERICRRSAGHGARAQADRPASTQVALGPFIPPADIGGGFWWRPRHRCRSAGGCSFRVRASPPSQEVITMSAQPSLSPAQPDPVRRAGPQRPPPTRPLAVVPDERLHPRHRKWRVALHHRAALQRDGAGDRAGQRHGFAREDLRRPEGHHSRPQGLRRNRRGT